MLKLKKILNELSYNYLYRYTPDQYVERAKDISVKLITKTPKGKYFYQTVTRSNGNVHKQWVRPLSTSNKSRANQDMVIWCDCGNFTYENEYVLWKKNSSNIVSSNGNPPIIRNPKRVTKLCKHLVAVLDDFKKRR